MLRDVYPEAIWFIDIEVFDEYGEEHWAQARFLVHIHNDSLWTNDPLEAALAVARTLQEINQEKDDSQTEH